MAAISIIEFVVYGIITYSGMLLIIASAFKETKLGKSESAVRVIWLIPCILTAYILGSVGGFDINLDTGVTTNTIINLNTTEVFTETFSNTKVITLINPIWTTVHLLFMTIIIFYVIWNIVMLFVKRD